MMDESEDYSGMGWFVDLVNKSNGYGGLFNYRANPADKASVEALVAQEWCASCRQGLDMRFSNLEMNPSDPPDFFCSLDNKRVGVELVQFVSQAHKKRANHRESPHVGQLFLDTQWTKARFEQDLNQLLGKKGRKYAKRRKQIDVLVVYSGEPWLMSGHVKDWIESIRIKTQPSIASVHFLMGYEPGREEGHWPIFRIY